MPPAGISRRRLLRMVGGGLVLAGAGVAFVRTRGYDMPAERARALKAFAPWQALVFDAVARRVAAPDEVGDAPSVDDVGVTDFVDGYVAAMHPAMRRDVLRLMGFVEHVAPWLAKRASRFSKLGPADQDAVLAALEASDEGMLRGAFAGLKSLVFMGYYRDPRTWKLLAWPGPIARRPSGGWW